MTRLNQTLVLLFVCLSFFNVAEAQIYDPVSFATEVEQADDGTFQLRITANIDEGWHMYSQRVTEEGGPFPTTIRFQESDAYQLVGDVSESEGHVAMDPIFEMEIKYFEDEAVFGQRIQREASSSFAVEGSVEYMVCDDEKCLPPNEKPFTASVPAADPSQFSSEQASANETASSSTQTEESSATNSEAERTANAENSAVSGEENRRPEDPSSAAVADTTAPDTALASAENSGSAPNTNNSEGTTTGTSGGSTAGWNVFWLSFLGGFAALLTPCVFPMIPLTVSYFTKQSKTRAAGIRNAFLYGFFIIAGYVALGSIVTALLGPSILNVMATSVTLNLVFFVLLVVFACSFLGGFEMVLPSSWSTAIDKKSGSGGVLGIAGMALVLAIVSFSCTGPIIGTLLVQSATQGGLGPIVGMLGFSAAIALPFMIFAAFPGWMNALPKSGTWLSSVKVFLGFLELALAFKFLSNADLVLQLHWLERETFLAIWIAIFGVLSLYLLGLIPINKPSNKTESIGVGRLMLAMVSLAFTLYMVPGLWGAQLQLISGFPPPMQYSESPYGVGYTQATATGGSIQSLAQGQEYGPQNIPIFKDYDKALAYAREVEKPLMIDFTGHACVNCRKMEERVWSEDQIKEILSEDVVLVSLYVDERRTLPESEQYISERTGNKIDQVGEKWSEFQIQRYGINAQPYYVLVDHDEALLNEPTAYTPDVPTYRQWLTTGIERFQTN